MRAMLALLLVGMLAGCSTGLGAGGTCGEPESVQVYDDPAPAAVAPACACDPCAGGACAVPQARVEAPALVGEYGYVLGPAGVREHIVAGLQWPVGWADCLATGAYKGVGVVLETVNCLLARVAPPAPAPSRNLVRLERVARPAGVVRPRATGPCGVPPAPQGPTDPNEPPPSIPAVRRAR